MNLGIQRFSNPAQGPYSFSLLNVLLMNIALVPAVIFLHEIGHAIAGTMAECSGISIMLHDFSTFETFTSMSCPGPINVQLALSGFLVVLPVAAMFMLLHNAPERHMGIVMAGFNLMLSFADIAEIAGMSAISGAAIFFGAAAVLFGEHRFVEGVLQRNSAAI
jgi:hypothetical protein